MITLVTSVNSLKSALRSLAPLLVHAYISHLFSGCLSLLTAQSKQAKQSEQARELHAVKKEYEDGLAERRRKEQEVRRVVPTRSSDVSTRQNNLILWAGTTLACFP